MPTIDELELPIGSAVCHCLTCGQTFASESAYDMHRPGRTLPVACLSVDQMVAKGMARNKYGRWVTRAWEDAAQVRMELNL